MFPLSHPLQRFSKATPSAVRLQPEVPLTVFPRPAARAATHARANRLRRRSHSGGPTAFADMGCRALQPISRSPRPPIGQLIDVACIPRAPPSGAREKAASLAAFRCTLAQAINKLN